MVLNIKIILLFYKLGIFVFIYFTVKLSKFSLINCCLFSRDIMTIYNEPPPGMFIVPDESDMTLVIKFSLLIKNYNFI